MSGYKSKIARDRICENCFWWTVRDRRDIQGVCDVETESVDGDMIDDPMPTFRDDYCDEFKKSEKRTKK